MNMICTVTIIVLYAILKYEAYNGLNYYMLYSYLTCYASITLIVVNCLSSLLPAYRVLKLITIAILQLLAVNNLACTNNKLNYHYAKIIVFFTIFSAVDEWLQLPVLWQHCMYIEMIKYYSNAFHTVHDKEYYALQQLVWVHYQKYHKRNIKSVLLNVQLQLINQN